MQDWENFRYFLVVARRGTVSGAAKEIGVSHSTVLRRIEQFESGLNSKLFKKLQRGYELTRAGERLYADGQSIESSLNQALLKAEGHHDVAQGKLRISQPELGTFSIYPLYSEFQRLHPEITLEINSTMASHNISQQEVDIVLRIAESPPELLVGRCLGLIKARVYASKKYLKRLPKNASIHDYEWVIWQRSAETTAKRWFKNNAIESKVVLYAESMPDVLSAVLSGMGAGFLSSHEARKHKSLVELFDGEVVSEYKLWMLTHRDLRNSERVKTFMRFMANNLILE
ncbi:MAG: DNA-binding transcriptional LysR family regulator [Pseudohongiellaceae bacterium]|jgi:DNA-binding transcriptional LysR family regulator